MTYLFTAIALSTYRRLHQAGADDVEPNNNHRLLRDMEREKSKEEIFLEAFEDFLDDVEE